MAKRPRKGEARLQGRERECRYCWGRGFAVRFDDEGNWSAFECVDCRERMIREGRAYGEAVHGGGIEGDK
jgi:hypothetical protein